MTTGRTDGPDFASTSVPRHLLRGLVGFGALVGALVLVPAVGPIAVLLLPVGVLALRGCPMCWTLGLLQTLSRGRVRRSCEEGRCAPTPAGRGTRGGSAVSVGSSGRRRPRTGPAAERVGGGVITARSNVGGRDGHDA
jgi:hypothetical protein